MKTDICYIPNHNKRHHYPDFFSSQEIEDVKMFHESMPGYEKTPLVSLNAFSKDLGIGACYVKDESKRYGLNAFKVTGGAYAMAKYLAHKWHTAVTFDELKKAANYNSNERCCFVTATDGNHGHGIAWAAKKLNQQAIVFMPKGSDEARLNRIKAEDATAIITTYNYDEAVRYAGRYADGVGGVLIQDTVVNDELQIPKWIMAGYAMIVLEIMEQIETEGLMMPTHVFLQAGVGSFAGSIAAFLNSKFKQKMPHIIVVEPQTAACFYKTAEYNDGQCHAVAGDMPTIMAGLACGEPNPMALPIIKDVASGFVKCSDEISAIGMRILANPLLDDPKVVSGESGAVGIGLIYRLMKDNIYEIFRKRIHLNEDSVVLIISTEGDTAPDIYQKIIWEGLTN